MSEPGPARHRQSPVWSLVAVVTVVAALVPPRWAGAQAPAGTRSQSASLLLYTGAGPPQGANFGRALPAELASARTDPEALARRAAGVAPGRLRELSRLERMLAEAREQAAALDEGGALSSLASAADLASGLGDVPGSAGYNAEVQLRLGVTAAQAGLPELATIALRRAATLDPARRLGAGEAPPQVVELSARLAREMASGPVGQLRVRAHVAGARVYVDDVDRGPAPAALRVSVGRHLLRVQAPGHVPYGAMIDVLQGVRPPIEVALAPDPALTAARALARSARGGDHAAVVRAVEALADAGVALAAVYVMEHGPGGARAIVVRCDAAGCRAPLRLSSARGAGQARWIAAAPLSDSELARARRWLRAAPLARARAEVAPAGMAAYLWVAAGTAVTALLAGAVLLAPEPERRLRVVVDPADIRP